MTRTQPAVAIEELMKRYGDVAAVDGVDLEITAGEIFGLLGPNGAGKSTTIESLVGLRTPTGGTIRVLGLDPLADRDRLRHIVAVQPQQAALFPTQTVLETLRLWASFHTDASEPEEVIGSLGLTESRDVRVKRLSGGQRQRLLVATALISNPRLLVLDEPSTGLDPNVRGELWTAIRAYRTAGGTVLLSTHAMAEAEALCDRVAIVDHGRVVACGAPTELIRAHAPEHEVSFATEHADGWENLRARPDVSDVSIDAEGSGARVTVRTTDTDGVLRTVLGGRDGVRDIQTSDGGLDTVFRVLTGRSFN